MTQLFHPLPGVTPTEEQAANVRTFIGDGTPYLRTPGLLTVRGVRCGETIIPLVLEQEFPEDATHSRLVRRAIPLIRREELPDGTVVLLRGIQSNDGIWQTGVPVYVQGDWDEGTEDLQASASDVLDSMRQTVPAPEPPRRGRRSRG